MTLFRKIAVSALLLAAWLAGNAAAQAQQFTVQQPVFRQFTAGTTVSGAGLHWRG